MAAVVSREIGQCAVEELELRPLGHGDVLVRIDASGICHSDVSLFDGSLRSRLPAVLGHEGCATVEAVGPGVTRLRSGDRVVLAAVAPCGLCPTCVSGEPYLCTEVRRHAAPAFLDGQGPVRGASGLGTLADALVVDERAAVAVLTDLPAEQLAVIGCAVLTGAGAVFNIAAVRPGDSVAVIGAGGIGLAAVQMAAALGAAAIAAVDPSDAARQAAASAGATHTFDVPESGLNSALDEVTRGRGFDAVLDCVGSATSFDVAWRATRRGGHVVLVGLPAAEVVYPVPLAEVVLSGRRVSGCVYGGSNVRRDIAMYVAMADGGRFDFGRLLGRTIDLDAAPDVIRSGRLGPGRTVVVN